MTGINIKKLDMRAITPTKGSEYAAGWDLYCIEDTMIPAGCTAKISTGLAIELPENTFGGIFARSGLATKKGLRPANAVGVIDADYRGEVIVALHNDSFKEQVVSAGERIAQLIILPFVPVASLDVVDELSDTVRGDGGFGSTGTD